MSARPVVASFGSLNIDRLCRVETDRLQTLAERYEWFPPSGETRLVEQLPPALEADVDRQLLGGKGANQAVAAAHAGAEARLYGKVGAESDERPRSTLAERGVDTSALETAPGPTGSAYIFLDPTGDNRIAVLPGANGAVDEAYVDRHYQAIAQAELLLLQNELPVAAASALLDRLAGLADRPTVVLDPAPASGAAPLVGHACVDVITPNESEAAALAGPLARTAAQVCYKHGPAPVEVEGPETAFEVSPPPADPVDSTGAGDVFAGYLGVELARESSMRRAVEMACVAAAKSVETVGVQRAVPAREVVTAECERYDAR